MAQTFGNPRGKRGRQEEVKSVGLKMSIITRNSGEPPTLRNKHKKGGKEKTSYYSGNQGMILVCSDGGSHQKIQIKDRRCPVEYRGLASFSGVGALQICVEE